MQKSSLTALHGLQPVSISLLMIGLCLFSGGCASSSDSTDAGLHHEGLSDASSDTQSHDLLLPGDGQAEGSLPSDGPLAEGLQPPDGSPDGHQADALPCQPTVPPLSNHIDPCLVRHGPDLLSPSTPTAAQAITVRLETQADDVQQVFLRSFTGIAREQEMSRVKAGDLDIFQAVVPASARPIYYRFKLVDGSATAFLTRGGLSSTTPTGADDFFLDPQASGKTLHYATDFSSPEVMLKSGGNPVAMSLQPDGLASVTGLGNAGQELELYIHDSANGNEDHPPGGGYYRMPPTLDEAWLYKGTLLDVPPDLLPADLIDCHTHPYNKVGNGWTYDPQPLLTLLPAQGITHALTMVSGAIATQQSELSALHQDHRWLIPLVWVRPQSHTVADVEDLLKNHGFKGLKFHPAVDNFNADDPMMDPFMNLAAAYHMPVEIHSDTSDNSGPQRIVNLALRHPDVKVVMIHTSLGALDKTAVLALIKTTNNVYADSSWTNPQTILQEMATLDSSRTLFGTDSTVDGYNQFTNQSIANPDGQYVYTIPQVIAEVRATANPDAFENWSRLTVIRLFDLRFMPEADLYDTDGDGLPDVSDPDDDNDGLPDSSDPAPLHPAP